MGASARIPINKDEIFAVAESQLARHHKVTYVAVRHFMLVDLIM